MEFKLKVNGSLTETFNVYSPQKSPVAQETPKTSHPNNIDPPSSIKSEPTPASNLFVFGASNENNTPHESRDVTPESTETK